VPAMRWSGLPGKRVEPQRAGMATRVREESEVAKVVVTSRFP